MKQEQQTTRGPILSFMRELVPDKRPTRQQFVWTARITIVVIVVLLAVLLLLYAISRLFGIELMQLLKVLAVPITVGGAVPLLNWLQKKRELDVEHQRAQDEALEAYLNQMGELLLDKKDRSLRTLPTPFVEDQAQDNEVHAHALAQPLIPLAQALTLTVLGRLDSNHKRSVLLFLHEAQLTSGLDLNGADLSGVDLSGAYLGGANLRGVNLRGANLSRAYLRYAQLSNADLSGADLRKAYLRKAYLSPSQDEDSYVRDLPAETTLRDADLSEADLKKASLGGVDLTGANLAETRVSLEALELVSSLAGATMPNGQKYEDWLRTPTGQDWLKQKKNLEEYKKSMEEEYK